MSQNSLSAVRVTSAAIGLLGPVLMLLMVGCGRDSETGEVASPDGERPRSHAATTAPQSTPTHTPWLTPVTEHAEDGRNLDACRDRHCEVNAQQGDTIRFAPRFVTDTFTVDRITDERVEFTVTADGSPFTGWMGGDGGEVESGDIHVDIIRTDDGGCILAFSPR